MLRAGMTLSQRFRVDHLLSDGGDGAFFLATDVVAGRAVLVRTVPDQDLARRAIVLGGLVLQSRVVGMHQQKGLVPVLGFGVEPSSEVAFLVLEHRTDRPIAELIAPGAPEQRTVAAFVEVARTLLAGVQSGRLLTAGAPRHEPVATPRPRVERDPAIPDDWVPEPTVVATHPRRPQRVERAPLLEARTPQRVTRAPLLEVRAVPLTPPPSPEPARRSGLLERTLAVLGPLGLVILALGYALLGGGDDDRMGVMHRDWSQTYGQREPTPSAAGDDRLLVARAQESAGRVRLMLSSDPPDAEVFDGRQRLGTTPLRLERPEAGRVVTLRLSKEGFKDGSVRLSASSPPATTVRLMRDGAARDRLEQKTARKPLLGDEDD
jgi:hypothetical protein